MVRLLYIGRFNAPPWKQVLDRIFCRVEFMIIRFYSSYKTGYPAKIENLLIEHFADQVVECYRDPKRFIRSFRIPGRESVVALLATKNPDELKLFADVGDLLCESTARIIVVSTTQTKHALKMTHRLRPSFITRIGDDLETLAAVLDKIICKEKKETEKTGK